MEKLSTFETFSAIINLNTEILDLYFYFCFEYLHLQLQFIP